MRICATIWRSFLPLFTPYNRFQLSKCDSPMKSFQFYVILQDTYTDKKSSTPTVWNMVGAERMSRQNVTENSTALKYSVFKIGLP
jgi:hypothetical protein